MPSLTLDQFRRRFPLLRRRVYVNSCSQGALSEDVEAALRAFADSWHAGGSPWDLWIGRVEELRARFAASVGAHPDEIAVLPSASAGINAVASAMTFSSGRSTVVMGEFEFPTMAQIWLAQERRGARIQWARARGELLPVEAYRERVDETTLVVPVTHVCFRNGFRLDVGALAALCRERGAYLFLDDYQRTGSAPLDVGALGVDFMVTGCLKYLLGPSGVAFLYVRRELVERFEPAFTGWFGRVNPFEFQIDRLDWSASARRFETGTPPIPNVYGALAGLDLLESVGYEATGRQIAALVERCVAGARAAGYSIATPVDPARRGPLVVVRSADAAELVRRLEARGVIASARGDGLRVSFHSYNNEEDVDAVLAALAAEAQLVEKSDQDRRRRPQA